MTVWKVFLVIYKDMESLKQCLKFYFLSVIKGKTNNYHTGGKIAKFHGKIVETEGKLIPLTHLYTNAHIPGLA